jgi:VRR-NUC domain
MTVKDLSDLPQWAQTQLKSKLEFPVKIPLETPLPITPKPRTYPEKDFMFQVIKLASLTDWLVYHTHNSKHSTPGFPDLAMVKDSHLLFAELKAPNGKLTPEQKKWLEALSKVERVSSHLWKPHDWQTIENQLSKQI